MPNTLPDIQQTFNEEWAVLSLTAVSHVLKYIEAVRSAIPTTT